MKKLIIFLMLCTSIGGSLAQTQAYELVESSKKDTFMRKVEEGPHERIIFTGIKIADGILKGYAVEAVKIPGKPYITKTFSYWIYDMYGLYRHKCNTTYPIIYDIKANVVHKIDEELWNDPIYLAWENILLWVTTLISGWWLVITWFIKRFRRVEFYVVLYFIFGLCLLTPSMLLLTEDTATISTPVTFAVVYVVCIIASIFLKPWHKIAGFIIVTNLAWFINIGIASGQWLPLAIVVVLGALGVFLRFCHNKIKVQNMIFLGLILIAVSIWSFCGVCS